MVGLPRIELGSTDYESDACTNMLQSLIQNKLLVSILKDLLTFQTT